jgi:hypothetical protein
MKLLTDLKHQSSLALAAAIENLLPRLTGRAEFAEAFLPRSDGWLDTMGAAGTGAADCS